MAQESAALNSKEMGKVSGGRGPVSDDDKIASMLHLMVTQPAFYKDNKANWDQSLVKRAEALYPGYVEYLKSKDK